MAVKQFVSYIIAVGLFFPAMVFAGESGVVPQRIVSLGSFVTESLYALGVQDRIVGVTTYCVRPEEAKKKDKAGNIVEVNLEKVIELHPDLVITTPLTDPKAKEKMRMLGINVSDLSQVKDFTQICEQFLFLGKIVGEQKKAEEIVLRAKEQVDAAQKSVIGLPRPKVFVQVGTKPLFTMNKDFFINDLIRRAGAVNIAEGSSSGIYSREKVIEEDPDCIIIATMGISGEEERISWSRYSQLKAVKNNKIFVVDPYLICGPMPDNFAAALEMMVRFVHSKEAVNE